MKVRTNRFPLIMIALLLLGTMSCNGLDEMGKKLAGKTSDKPEPKMKLDKEQFMEWVHEPENGLIAEKTLDNLSYQFIYKPVAYEALLRSYNDSGFVMNSYKQNLTDLAGTQYCTFRISSPKVQGELLRYALPDNDEYYRRIEYCSYGIQNDIKLIDGNDTLDCVLHHYERAYTIAPEVTITLAFNQKDPAGSTGDKTLYFEDNLFGNGIINLKVTGESINQVPEIKFN